MSSRNAFSLCIGALGGIGSATGNWVLFTMCALTWGMGMTSIPGRIVAWGFDRLDEVSAPRGGAHRWMLIGPPFDTRPLGHVCLDCEEEKAFYDEGSSSCESSSERERQ